MCATGMSCVENSIYGTLSHYVVLTSVLYSSSLMFPEPWMGEVDTDQSMAEHSTIYILSSVVYHEPLQEPLHTAIAPSVAQTESSTKLLL